MGDHSTDTERLNGRQSDAEEQRVLFAALDSFR